MAVAQDITGAAHNSGSGGTTMSVAVNPTSSASVLIAASYYENTSGSVTATQNGNSMTKLANLVDASWGAQLDLFAIASPTAGAGVDFTFPSTNFRAAMAIGYTGTSLTLSAPDFTSGTNNSNPSTTLSLSLNTSVAGSWMFIFGYGQGTFSAGTNSTEIDATFGTNIKAFDSNGTITTGGFSMTTNATNNSAMALIGTTIAPGAGVTPFTVKRNFALIGVGQ